MRLLPRRKPVRGPQVRSWSASDSDGSQKDAEAAHEARAKDGSLAPQPDAPSPQPERREPELTDPGPPDLSKRDWKAIIVRAGKQALEDGITDVAAALAYYAFLAIPAALLVTLGLFTVLAGRDTVTSIMDSLQGVVPRETISLLQESLNRSLEGMRILYAFPTGSCLQPRRYIGAPRNALDEHQIEVRDVADITGNADAALVIVQLTTQLLHHSTVQSLLAHRGDFSENQHGSHAAPPPPVDLVTEDAAIAAWIVSNYDPATLHFQVGIERTRDESPENVCHTRGIGGID